MKIALVSTFVPFVFGGARNIVDWLQSSLQDMGHQVERVYLPQVDTPDLLFQQMMAFRWIDLEAADRVICFRPQAHLIQHRHKIVWFIHHIRSFYDMWGGEYGPPDDTKHRSIRDALRQTDTRALKEAKAIFTNSKVVSARLSQYNQIDSEVLYPPVFEAHQFHCAGYSDDIVYICRLEHHKRQHLLIEAMKHVKTPIKLKLYGASSGTEYPLLLKNLVAEAGLEHQVQIDDRWISDEEKIRYLSECLAAAYLPFDEDSYGYPSVEASHAQKPILTTTDSGGVLELVQDGFNGYITEPDAVSLASAMDRFYINRQTTIRMGQNARDQIDILNISWSHVLKRLLS